MGTFVIDLAPAVTDITAAGIAILAVVVLIFGLKRVMRLVR